MLYLKLFKISASACERNWSTFNQVHTKRRNRLHTTRMNNLVYVMYNKKLKHKFMQKSNLKDGEDGLIVENVSSDDEWIANPSGDDENVDIEVGEAIGEVGETITEVGETIREVGGTSTSRPRKRNRARVTLIDEDDDEEVNLIDEDEDDVRIVDEDGFYDI